MASSGLLFLRWNYLIFYILLASLPILAEIFYTYYFKLVLSDAAQVQSPWGRNFPPVYGIDLIYLYFPPSFHLTVDCQLSKPGDRSNFNINKTCWKCCYNNDRRTGQKQPTVRWNGGGRYINSNWNLPIGAKTWYLKVLIKIASGNASFTIMSCKWNK